MFPRNLSVFLKQFIRRHLIKRSICKITLDDCPKPLPPMNIAITGASSDVGQIAALLLKQAPRVKNIFLYDTINLDGISSDLCCINSSTCVETFCGLKNLKDAIEEARIVLICGGHQTMPDETEESLFYRNADMVREIVMHCAEFNPEANIIIATPPVSSLVPMAVEECKKADVFNSKRIYGLVTANVITTRSMVGDLLNLSPVSVRCPVVGGEHRRMFVPVFSQMTPTADIKSMANENLTRNIQEAQEDVLYTKCCEECCPRSCYLTIGYAAVKFISSLMTALEGKPIMECIYVKQEHPLKNVARYFTTTVELGRDGIKAAKIPKLNKKETTRVQNVVGDIRDSIFIGESYITGEDKPVIRPECLTRTIKLFQPNAPTKPCVCKQEEKFDKAGCKQ